MFDIVTTKSRKTFDIVTTKSRKTFDIVTTKSRETFDIVTTKSLKTFDIVTTKSVFLKFRFGADPLPYSLSTPLLLCDHRVLIQTNKEANVLKQ